jgi:peroxiredoxin Q/BCP
MRLLARLLIAVAWAVLAARVGLSPAAESEDVPKVEVGKPAPPVELEATQIAKYAPDHKDAKTLKLSDFSKGSSPKNVVLFFYPKAMTPGCTRESCKFRDLNADFAKVDTVVLGISTDKLDAQKKFTEKESLNFPLLADSDKRITKSFGVLNKERGMALRSTFVIDKKGIIRKIYPSANADKNPEEVLNWIKENLKD